MKRIFVFIFCLSMVCCGPWASSGKVDTGSFVDLEATESKCSQPIYPRLEGRKCHSGDYTSFTIRRLTDFGERPVWSPDGKKIAFVDKEFGNAYEMEMATGEITCITCEFGNEGYLRVHYILDGDYLLLGPKKYKSDLRSRIFDTGFWWMPTDRSSPPKWIGEKHHEGVAVSRESRLIAYSKTWLNRPFFFPSRIFTAEITTDGEIVNRKVVYRSVQIIEAQDFLPGDSGLIFSRYTPTYEVMGIDFSTGRVTNYSRSPASEEPEGIFPDGEFTLMESDRHARKRGDMDIDIYMLRLDGTGKDVRRLTHFSDTPGEKASNPVVSPDGCRIAFMKGKHSESRGKLTGEGDGIFLLEFCECGQ